MGMGVIKEIGKVDDPISTDKKVTVGLNYKIKVEESNGNDKETQKST